MQSSQLKYQELLQHHAIIAILICICGLLGYIAYKFNFIQDYTQNQRNVLSIESKHVLHDMHSPIEIQAFASDSPAKGRYFRKSIQTLINKYQQHKSDISLTFIDPSTNPTSSRDYQINDEGEMIVQYQNRQEKMQLPYTEEALTNLLLKLQYADHQHLLLMQGHQEPSHQDTTANGLSKFSNLVKTHGWNIESASFKNPSNSNSIMMLIAPRSPYHANELQIIHKHLLAGGNLIWMLGTPDNDIQPLADALGISLEDGIVVDPSISAYGLEKTAALSSQYSQKSIITQDLKLRSLFPNVRRVVTNQTYNKIWKANHLIGVAENGWLSPSTAVSHKNKLIFNAETDTQGPINIAVSLERVVNQKSHRVLVIGSHEFINNQNIEFSGNSELIKRMLSWTINHHPQTSIIQKPLKDTVVIVPDDSFNRALLLILFNGFQFALPLTLFVLGYFVWKRKSFSGV